MEKITLNEQDLVNAICLFHAKFRQVSPAEVEVELMYDDETGFSAEASVHGQQDIYSTANFIAAIRLYIDEQLNRDSMSARILLNLHDDEGIIANIEW
ncbi:MAG TPA: YxcD family protein [Ureibacillus sp.]|nr:YxcD family protein [Ureibacillus sp.]